MELHELIGDAGGGSRPERQVYSGTFARTVTAVTDDAWVTCPAIDPLAYVQADWTPTGSAFPQAGADCLVAFDERQKPYVVQWGMGSVPTSPPMGAAGGDLAGTYPNPTIGANKVVTSKILDANVTTAKIADANVTNAKLADASVNAEKLGALTSFGYSANNGALGVGAPGGYTWPDVRYATGNTSWGGRITISLANQAFQVYRAGLWRFEWEVLVFNSGGIARVDVSLRYNNVAYAQDIQVNGGTSFIPAGAYSTHSGTWAGVMAVNDYVMVTLESPNVANIGRQQFAPWNALYCTYVGA